MWSEIGDNLHSKCKVAGLLWFAHFGMRICAGAQLLSRSHVVDHTSILSHFLGEFDWSKVFFWE